MICALQGHPLRELNLSRALRKHGLQDVTRGGNQLTDVGLLEVLALLRQDGGHLEGVLSMISED